LRFSHLTYKIARRSDTAVQAVTKRGYLAMTIQSETQQGPILGSEEPREGLDFHAINYPFSDKGRAASRLLFDFGVAVASMLPDPPNDKVLDVGCGTGWTSEMLNKLGYDVYGLDTDKAALELAKKRMLFDRRIQKERFHFQVANGHHSGLPDQTFGHILFFDSLHHMADYEQIFREVHRLLCVNGRAIFVEPGSRHSRSPETIRFLKEAAKGEDWIEKDVDLKEIWDLCNRVGLSDLRIKPFLLPANVEFSFVDWFHILENRKGQQNYLRELRRFVWEDRVIFHVTRK
jgi:SAM-dependent methyltransferase